MSVLFIWISDIFCFDFRDLTIWIIVKISPDKSHLRFFEKKLAKISPYQKILLFKISQNLIRKTIKLTKNDQETVSERFFRPDEIELGIGSNCEIIFFANWPFLGMRVMR
jgi:hypothetical protein